MIRPVINIADLTLDTWSKGDRYAATDASFSRQIGVGIRDGEPGA